MLLPFSKSNFILLDIFNLSKLSNLILSYFGNELTLSPFPNKPVFTYQQYKSFENTVGKGEIARNEQFLLFPQCFQSFLTIFCHFHKIQNCGLPTLSAWKSLNLVWERVNVQSK